MIGWATSDRLHTELALSALRRAVILRSPPAGQIHHADRSSQYCLIEYQAELRRRSILISMSGKENCYDNAMAEFRAFTRTGGVPDSIFKTLKVELVWHTVFQSRAAAVAAIGRYIDGFYNPVRRHSALDVISPIKFETPAVQHRNRSTLS